MENLNDNQINNKDFASLIAEIVSETKIESAGFKPTVQNKAEIYNKFHRPFFEKLMNEISPVLQLYNNVAEQYFMSVNVDNINSQKFFKLNEMKQIDCDNLSSVQKGVMENARSIVFHLALQDIKTGYRLKNIPIFIFNLGVIFEDNYYSFNGKSYAYSKIPSEEDMMKAIEGAKNVCLDALEKARKQ